MCFPSRGLGPVLPDLRDVDWRGTRMVTGDGRGAVNSLSYGSHGHLWLKVAEVCDEVKLFFACIEYRDV